jgi:glycosyltransferase involved in cell wall biosynthesis
MAQRIPLDIRAPLSKAARAQADVCRHTWHALAAALARLSTRLKAPRAPGEPQGRPLRDLARPGDILCSFGSPWFVNNYDQLLREAKADLGIRVAILAYDLIPVIRPEYVSPELVEAFGSWCRRNLPLADRLFAISRATAIDVERWAAEEGLSIARPVIPLPIGTGFSDTPNSDAALPSRVVDGDYALFVSTIEPRKNHDLAFRVWRNLLSQLPNDRVPKLVFAGRVGWMSGDLMQRIENSHNLDGKLVIIHEPTDGDLVSLYRHCTFSLFPSLYEGWGLPVTESLGFAKPCIASDRTAVPEAGGSLCIYIDPDNVTGATATIRTLIEDRAILRSLEDRIHAEFRPTPWSETAKAILSQI